MYIFSLLLSIIPHCFINVLEFVKIYFYVISNFWFSHWPTANKVNEDTLMRVLCCSKQNDVFVVYANLLFVLLQSNEKLRTAHLPNHAYIRYTTKHCQNHQISLTIMLHPPCERGPALPASSMSKLLATLALTTLKPAWDIIVTIFRVNNIVNVVITYKIAVIGHARLVTITLFRNPVG